MSRRGFLRGAGPLGAGATASVLATPSATVAAGLPHSHGPSGGGSEQGSRSTGSRCWAAGVAEESARLDTCDFVRPQYRDAELVLTATPAAGGLLVPFETRNPTPCCADH